MERDLAGAAVIAAWTFTSLLPQAHSCASLAADLAWRSLVWGLAWAAVLVMAWAADWAADWAAVSAAAVSAGRRPGRHRCSSCPCRSMHCRCRSSPAWQHGTPASHCGINQTWESAKKSPTSYWARWWQLHCCQLNAPGTHIDAAAQRHAGALGSLALGAAFSRSSRCSMVASSKLSAAVGTGGRASADVHVAQGGKLDRSAHLQPPLPPSSCLWGTSLY